MATRLDPVNTNRRALFAVACVSLFTFGIVLTTLGALLPSIIDRFGIDKAAAGSLFLLNTFGIVIGSVVFGPIADRNGYKEMLVGATALIIVGLEAIAFAPSMTVLRGAVLLTGFGGGIINGGANALVADISVDGRTAGLSKLHVFFGAGAVGVPFALGILLGKFTYSVLIAVVGALCVIPLVITAVPRFPVPKQAQGFPIATARALLRDPVLLTFSVMLFLESGMEITVGGWTATFFKEELLITDQRALIYLSLYWFGLMVGRMGLSAALHRIAPARLLGVCITVAFGAAWVVITAHEPSFAALGVFLLGVGFSATFPVVLGFVADRHVALSGTAFSIAMVIALIGGMLLPYLTGVLGTLHGLRSSFLVVPMSL
ncbi:MAG TPA: MFS transporter, partial [Gemmatimonadaceae bacterium]|nr:MFS transporter [Gemmatimonadaceae bacterium]